MSATTADHPSTAPARRPTGRIPGARIEVGTRDDRLRWRWPLGWLRRRGWVLVVTTALAATIAAGLGSGTSVTYETGASFYVPSGATADGPGNVFEANLLAGNYAQLLTRSETVLSGIASATDLTQSEVGAALLVRAIPDTAVIDVTFEVDDPETASAGIRSLVRRISAGSGLVTTGTLELASLQDTPVAQRTNAADAAALGAILGVALGVVLVVVWERADPRVDVRSQLESIFDGPVHAPSDDAEASALLQRFADDPLNEMRLLPVGGAVLPTLPRSGRAVTVERPGTADAPVADDRSTAGGGDPDSVPRRVLIVGRGARAAVVAGALDRLRRVGVVPDAALLLEPRRTRRGPRRRRGVKGRRRA